MRYIPLSLFCSRLVAVSLHLILEYDSQCIETNIQIVTLQITNFTLYTEKIIIHECSGFRQLDR